MADVGVDILVDDQGNDRDPARMRRVDHIAARIPGDAPVRIGVVPRRAQHIDLAQVGEQRRVTIIGVDVIHLHHTSRRDLRDRRRNRYLGPLLAATFRSIGRVDARVDRHRRAVGELEAS